MLLLTFMNFEIDQIQDVIARRLTDKTETDMPRKKKAESTTALAETQTALPSTEFVKVEKNLNSLGFFTPSSKTIKEAKSKTIAFTRMVDGKKVEAKVTIAPAAIYGLPMTADQDKYLALQKIITNIRQEKGIVTNPIGFTSAEILRLLGQADAGKNYNEIHEWMNRMTATTVISEGAVYLAGKKKWARDRFHVFERSVAVGEELDDGSVSDMHYVWLSDWQLENINNNHLLPIDFETYKKLKSHIAKALVPMLQVWLFASAEKGSFEKRYDELCQYLNISQYKHLSKIKEKLGPALDELKSYGYISKWKIEPTSDKKSFKIVFYHGEKFHRDRRQRLGYGESAGAGEGQQTGSIELTEEQKVLVSALVERGVLESAAVELIASLPADQPVRDQLEWIDELVKKEGTKIKNKPGFLIHLLRGNIAVPTDFITTRKRSQIEAARAAAEEDQRRQFETEAAYEVYQENLYQEYLQTRLDQAVYLQMIEEEKKRVRQLAKGDLLKDTIWQEQGWYDQMAKGAVKRRLIERVSCMSYDEFWDRYWSDPDFAEQYKPVFERQT
jgi:hypothetical protein